MARKPVQFHLNGAEKAAFCDDGQNLLDLLRRGVEALPPGGPVATPAAIVPTPTSETSFTLTRASRFAFFKSWMSCARSSMEFIG